jgi:succinate dehydrogenase / fumarate reductase, cytochrome b subunit
MTQSARPLSPHLQIYRPQWTSVLSIMHRISGIALCAAGVALLWGLQALANGPESYAVFLQCIRGWLGKFIGGAILLALSYHLCNGIRHLYWDTGRGLDLPSAERSAFVCVGATIGLTVATLYFLN